MFNKTEYNEAPLARRSAPFKNRIVVSSEGMIVTQSLNPTKALGQDEFILKELSNELGPVFAHLFQHSFDTVEILKEWLVANICSLFEKGDIALDCNYRPVSLTCAPC